MLLHAATPQAPDWAQPGSATHQQVPPPAGFHRPTVNFDEPIGIFQGQSDVGGPLVPGSASYDAETGSYTIDSAGYNIWYFRDEFRYLWKRMEGDVSLAADIEFPNPDGYGDRKVVLIFRQELDDDAKEIMVALHGVGLVHLATRPDKGADIYENLRVEASASNVPAKGKPVRLGIQKKGDQFTLWATENGGPLKQVGKPAELSLDGPFYVGIAFTSHLPVTSDTAVVSNVLLENEAGKVK
ncbi:hypothetical protein VDG1235_495 [Verrucomicrobiia bacterium DG1235]|nr:hypothetical protein VDG1235_495 [Verrucomicrobiae bacterium DG1235]